MASPTSNPAARPHGTLLTRDEALARATEQVGSIRRMVEPRCATAHTAGRVAPAEGTWVSSDLDVVEKDIAGRSTTRRIAALACALGAEHVLAPGRSRRAEPNRRVQGPSR